MSALRCWNQVSCPIISPPRTTYSGGIWHFKLGRLEFILIATVRVVRKGFCCSPDGSGPEEKPLCSKTPDEDAFVLRIILLIRQRNGQCTARECSQENGLGGADCCDMPQLHAHCAN